MVRENDTLATCGRKFGIDVENRKGPSSPTSLALKMFKQKAERANSFLSNACKEI